MAMEEILNTKIRWSDREKEELVKAIAPTIPEIYITSQLLASIKKAQEKLVAGNHLWKGRTRNITTVQMVPWLPAMLKEEHTRLRAHVEQDMADRQAKTQEQMKRDALESLSTTDLLNALVSRISQEVLDKVKPEVKAYCDMQIAMSVASASQGDLRIEKTEKARLPQIALVGFMSAQCQAVVRNIKDRHGSIIDLVCINKDHLPSQQAEKAAGATMVICNEQLNSMITSKVKAANKNFRLASSASTATTLVEQFIYGMKNGHA